MHFDHLRRREFIALLGSAAKRKKTGSPTAAMGQKPKLPHCNSNGGFHLKERT
jgi:hypothetical protein